jgi:hypothetical protein
VNIRPDPLPSGKAVRAEAERGLREAGGLHLRFWRLNRERNAAVDRALDRIESAARNENDKAALGAVALARAGGKTLAEAPKVRLTMLRAALSALESGVAGGASGLAALSVSLSNSLDAEQKALYGERLDAALLQENARGGGDRFTATMAHLQSAGARASTALRAIAEPPPATIPELAATVTPLIRDDATRLAALADLGEAAKQDHDARVAAILGRSEQWHKAAPSVGARIDAVTLEAIAARTAASPEASLAMAAKVAHPAVARAALDEAATAQWPEGSAVGAWLGLRAELAKQALPPEAQAAADVAIVAKCGTAPELPTQIEVLAAAADKGGDPDRLLAVAERIDAARGGTQAAAFAQWRGLAARLATHPDMARLSLREALSCPAVGLEALSAFGARVGRSKASLEDLQDVTQAILATAADGAKGNPRLERWLQSVSQVSTLPMGDEKATRQLLSNAMGQNVSGASLAECAAAAQTILGSSRFYLDRTHMAPVLTAGLPSADAAEAAKVAFLRDVAGLHDPEDAKSVSTAILNGLKILAKEPNKDLPTFVRSVAMGAGAFIDALSVAKAGLTRMAGQAAANNDADRAECLAFLDKVAEVPAADEQYRWGAVNTGLAHVAAPQTRVADPVLGLVARVLSAKLDLAQRIGIGRAAAEVLQVRARRTHNLDLEAQATFLQTLCALPFSNHDSHAASISQAVATMCGHPGPGEQGLATIALDFTKVGKTYRDDMRVMQAALKVAQTQARSGGDQSRQILLDTLASAARTENYEDRYQFAVTREAVKAVAQRTEAEPGALAQIGLAMVNGAYYWQSMLALGDVLLDGLDRLAAAEKDRAFTPVLVEEARKKIAAAADPKAKVAALGDGLGQLSKLQGDEFRKALLRALQGEQPGDAPKIESGDDCVVIGGIKVPRK